MSVTLPWVVAEAIRPHTEAPVEHYIPLRGSVEGSFGETHLVLTTHGSMLAVSKTSALGAMETLMLDGQVLPEWVSDRWGDALAVHDLGGKRYTVQLDSLGRDQALAALAHLYRCRMAWRHLARVLEKQIEASYDDDKRHALALELARLQRLEFGQRQQARDVYEQILLHRPRQHEALSELLELFRSGFELERTGRDLPSLLAGVERWEDALFVRDVQLEYLSDPSERLTERMEVAEGFWRLQRDGARAIAAAGGALCEAPSLDAPWDIIDAASADGTHDLLVADLLACLIEVTGHESQELQASVLSRHGKLLQRLGRIEASEATWRRLVALGMPAAREGFEALYAIVDQRDDPAQLVELIGLELAQTTETQRRVELLCGRAELAVAAGDATLAESCFTEALELFDEHRPALEGLRSLYHLNGPPTALYAVLNRLQELELDATRRVAFVKAMATTAENQLADPDRAIADWYRVRSIAPDDAAMIVALPALLRQRGRVEELAGVLADRIGHGGRSAQEREQLRRDLARLYQHEMDAPERAENVWKAVLESSERKDEEALFALFQLRQKAGDLQGARTYLERLVEVLPEPRMSDVLRRLAGVCEQLGDGAQALVYWERLRQQHDTDVSILEALVRVACPLDEWVVALSAQKQRVALADTERARGQRLTELARLLQRSAARSADPTGQLEAADRVLEEASLLQDVERVQIALARSTILAELERWSDLAELAVASIIPGCTDPAERRQWLDDVVEIYTVRLNTPLMALKVALKWLDDIARMPARCRRIAELAVSPEYDALPDVLAGCAQLSGEMSARVLTHLREAATSCAAVQALVDIGLWHFDRGHLVEAEDCFLGALTSGERSERALDSYVRTLLSAGRGAQARLQLDAWLDSMRRDDGGAWRSKLLKAAVEVARYDGDEDAVTRYERQRNARWRVGLWLFLVSLTVLGALYVARLN